LVDLANIVSTNTFMIGEQRGEIPKSKVCSSLHATSL